MSTLVDSDLLRQAAYVCGHWTSGRSGVSSEVRNPADGSLVGRVPKISASEVAEAVEASQRAMAMWGSQTAKARGKVLSAWARLIETNVDDLALIMTLEQGKPLAEARGEVLYAAAFFEWYAEEGKRAYGDIIPSHGADKRILVLKQSIGVCAAITPWNFPAAMVARKAAPALAAGCGMVLKPASQTPFSALAMAVLGERAGLPAGLFSVVTGSAQEIGRALTSHASVRLLSFTGSTEVGKHLMAECASTVKKVALELGGNAPFIVFDDADLESAVKGAMASKFRNSGQTCVCANRLFVQRGIHDRFVERFSQEIATLKVGAGINKEVTMGPLIDRHAVAKVQQHIQDATAKGAQLVRGGKAIAGEGNFFEPTLMVGATQDMLAFKEETFGPLAPIFKFETDEEVVRLANATEFGLAAYVYTNDLRRTWHITEALEAGIVAVNDGIVSYEGAPFGGVKESGGGREGSKYGLEEFMTTKYVLHAGL